MNSKTYFWYMHNNWYKYCIQHQNPKHTTLLTKGPLNLVLFHCTVELCTKATKTISIMSLVVFLSGYFPVSWGLAAQL